MEPELAWCAAKLGDVGMARIMHRDHLTSMREVSASRLHPGRRRAALQLTLGLEASAPIQGGCPERGAGVAAAAAGAGLSCAGHRSGRGPGLPRRCCWASHARRASTSGGRPLRALSPAACCVAGLLHHRLLLLQQMLFHLLHQPPHLCGQQGQWCRATRAAADAAVRRSFGVILHELSTGESPRARHLRPIRCGLRRSLTGVAAAAWPQASGVHSLVLPRCDPALGGTSTGLHTSKPHPRCGP